MVAPLITRPPRWARDHGAATARRPSVDFHSRAPRRPRGLGTQPQPATATATTAAAAAPPPPGPARPPPPPTLAILATFTAPPPFPLPRLRRVCIVAQLRLWLLKGCTCPQSQKSSIEADKPPLRRREPRRPRDACDATRYAKMTVDSPGRTRLSRAEALLRTPARACAKWGFDCSWIWRYVRLFMLKSGVSRISGRSGSPSDAPASSIRYIRYGSIALASNMCIICKSTCINY